jgi:hypothetical protein
MNSDAVTHFLGIWKSRERPEGPAHCPSEPRLTFRTWKQTPPQTVRGRERKAARTAKGRERHAKEASQRRTVICLTTEERSPKRKKKYVEPDGEDEEGDIEIDGNGKGHKKAKLGRPEPKRKGKNPQNQESEDEGPPDGSPCLAGISDEPQLVFLKSLNSDPKYQVLVTALAMEEVCVLCWFGFCGLMMSSAGQ